MSKKPTVLMILDGYGLNDRHDANAVYEANTPVMDKLMAEYPFVKGNASGLAVGLPEGQMGNSEVGHMNMGAGRIVYQELTRITKEIQDGDFFKNEALLTAMKNAKENDSAIHFMGLLSDGGVHSHITHLFGLLQMAKNEGLKKVYVHCFLDGRDTPPASGKGYIQQLQAKMDELGVGEIGVVSGRYYAMDRDNRWDRVELAYNALTKGEGVKGTDAAEAVQASYDDGKTDEFVLPTVIEKDGKPETIEGDIFLSSMPVKDLVAGMNDVPAEMAKIAAGLPYRDFVTVGLLLDKLNLKNETDIPTLGNIVPDCWIYVQDVGVKLGRIQIFNNWSPYMVQDPEHTVWIGLEYFCAEGDKFWNMSDQECINFAVKELVSMGVISSPSDVKDSHRERIKKAYPAYFDTYAQIDDLIAYLNRFENLFCIGRNGQHRYNNMDHSMATAFEAVDNICAGKTDKKNVWNVNTEKEYHEEKKES